MANRTGVSILAVAAACSWAVPAAAQNGDAAIREELAAMRAQMAQMAARMESLQAQLDQANAKASAAEAASANAVTVTVAAAAKEAAPTTEISWKGAPEYKSDGGWTFKPRGRMQIDAGTVGSPAGITDKSTGFGSEMRRAYLGFEGKVPGGFGYRAEIDVANSSVEITDFYLTYQASRALTLTVGQQKPAFGLEELTSDLFTSFTERAAINNAFGYERRLGISAAYAAGDVIVQGGVFSDNLADLNNDENNSLGYNGRVVFAPKLGGGQLHLGGSAHFRDLNDSATSVRYRVRPFIHTPDIRFIDTGSINATSESGYGLEAAYITGPLHLTGETHWQSVERVAGPNPTFFGGYAEVGYFLTRGDTRGYKGGTFDRINPKNPVGSGGIGAVQVNLRYDYLDLNDAGIVGGKQDGFGVAIVWTPTAYTRLMANYGRMEYSDAAIPAAGGERSYGVDAFGVRAQVDF
ncbi:OprO/OprP family phosphate-selective porin [Tsuneonella sp. HG222]